MARSRLTAATWEAEVGELLEPRGRGCGELRSHHFTPLGVRAKVCLEEKKKKLKFRLSATLFIFPVSGHQLHVTSDSSAGQHS